MDAVTLVVWCQTFQQSKDLVGALNTLAIADSMSITPKEAHYTVLLSCAANMKSLSATQRIHQHLMSHPTDKILIGALVHSYAQCGDLESSVSVFEAALRDGMCFDVTGWSCLMGAYTKQGIHSETQATQSGANDSGRGTA